MRGGERTEKGVGKKGKCGKIGVVEVCPSGLRSTLGKRVCGQPYRRFESSRFRQKANNKNRSQRGLFLLCSPAENEDSRHQASIRKRKQAFFSRIFFDE